MTSDHETMLAVRNGDIEKLGILFDRHKKHLFNYFRLGTGNRDASEDLVQDVFLRMLKYRQTYRDSGDFKVWMFTIARNVRTDYFRARAVIHEPIEEHEELVGDDPVKSDAADRSDDIALITSALSGLPEDMRELILLSKFNKVRYRDIGIIMNCSEGAVKVRVFRAMQELKDMYHKLRGDESHEV